MARLTSRSEKISSIVLFKVDKMIADADLDGESAAVGIGNWVCWLKGDGEIDVEEWENLLHCVVADEVEKLIDLTALVAAQVCHTDHSFLSNTSCVYHTYVPCSFTHPSTCTKLETATSIACSDTALWYHSRQFKSSTVDIWCQTNHKYENRTSHHAFYNSVENVTHRTDYFFWQTRWIQGTAF